MVVAGSCCGSPRVSAAMSLAVVSSAVAATTTTTAAVRACWVPPKSPLPLVATKRCRNLVSVSLVDGTGMTDPFMQLARPAKTTFPLYSAASWSRTDAKTRTGSAGNRKKQLVGNDKKTTTTSTSGEGSWKLLLQMCRLANLPVVFLFHGLAVYRVVSTMATATMNQGSLWSWTMLQPGVMATLLCLVLISTTSMVINDYYDARLGVDTDDKGAPSRNLIASGRVSYRDTKFFLSVLYAVTLLLSSLVPGALARLTVALGLISTYLYTAHLKPKTWWKNITCAALVASSPLTSGSAAVTTLAHPSQPPLGLLFHSLGRLIVVLSSGMMSREMTMDLQDVADDARAGVVTVPVKYGLPRASAIAAVLATLSASVAVLGPAHACWTSTATLSPSAAEVRRLVLALLGGSMMTLRALQVWWTARRTAASGETNALQQQKQHDTIDRAVEEYKLSVLFVVASFV